MRKIALIMGLAAIFATSFAVLPQSAGAAFGDLSVSQSNVFVNVGQQTNVNLNISSNQIANIVSITNTSAVNAYISGNTLNIYGVNSGSSQIGVCTTSDQCAYIFVTVGVNNNNNNNGNISLSQTNVSLNAGQNSAISIYGNNNFNSNYYISSNSNSNVASGYISNNTLNVYANQTGSTTITICAYNYSGCATLYVNVSGSNNSNITLSQTSVSLNAGQNSIINIFSNGSSNNSNYYVSSNSNSNVVTTNISGNSLNVYANQNGSTNITVCSYNFSGNCATLYVTVYGNNNSGNLVLSPNSINLQAGQTGYVTISGNYGTAYVSNNANSSVANISISNNQVNVYANQQGSTTATICAYGNYNQGNQCSTLYISVNGYNNCNQSYPYNCNNNYSLSFPSVNMQSGSINQYYNASIQVNGGSAPYSFSLNSGSLPPGLSLSYNGSITGVPTQNGSYTFAVRATDTFGRTGISNNIFLNIGSVAGASLYNNGTLIKENNTIYIVYKNTKSGFTNMQTFSGFGFKLEMILETNNTGLFDSNHLISNSNTSHPWGSWIKSNGTIYFVHESGLIPVPSYDIFKNNGGQDYLVVPANIYDFNRQTLPLMNFNDSRLK